MEGSEGREEARRGRESKGRKRPTNTQNKRITFYIAAFPARNQTDSLVQPLTFPDVLFTLPNILVE